MPTLYKNISHQCTRRGIPVEENFGVSGQGDWLSREEQKLMFEGLKHCRANSPNRFCEVHIGAMRVKFDSMVHYAPHSSISDYESESKQAFTVEITDNPFSENAGNKIFKGWVSDPWVRRNF